MIVDNNLVVFDLETNGLSVDSCNVVEIACVILDPDKLTIIPGSEFESLARPANLDELDDTDEKKKALAVSGIDREAVKDAPLEETVIKSFAAHIKKICGRKKAVPCGYNIENFDIPVYNRLCRQYKLASKDGSNPSFLTGLILDAKQDINRWFYQSKRLLHPGFDAVRDLFGMSKGDSVSKDRVHRARYDVHQEARLVIRFLRLYQKFQDKISFANCEAGAGGLLE